MSDDRAVSPFLDNALQQLDATEEVKFVQSAIALVNGEYILAEVACPRDDIILAKAAVLLTHNEEGMLGHTLLNNFSDDYIQRIDRSQVLTISKMNENAKKYYKTAWNDVLTFKQQQAYMNRQSKIIEQMEEEANEYASNPNYHEGTETEQ